MPDCEEEAAYYLRFISMYIDLGTEVVLKVFVHHTPGKDAESFLLSDPVKKKLLQLTTRKILNEQESKLVLEQPPNPKKFDVSLLVTLSSNLFSEQQLSSPKKGWNFPPINSDKSISADLLRLRTIRNQVIGHSAKAQLPQWKFEDEWAKVEEIFLRIYRKIAPDEESQLKQTMEAYRFRKLDSSTVNKYNSKINEWHQEISKVQQQVEDACKTLKDIDKYIKDKSDRYERYIKLLVKGGRFVISAFIEDNIKTHNKTLEEILKEKEDYVRKSIGNQDHLHILYPSDQGDTSKPIDMSTWDITLLATVLLQVLDSNSLDKKVKRAINMINTARNNYAEAAVVSLHSDEFQEYSYHLKYSIQFLSGYLDQQKQIKCEEILSECQHISKNADEHQTYFNELENQSLKIKSIQQIYTETVKKTKDILQEMLTHGHEHVLELKIITLGSDEEKKQLGETVLTEIWREALERSNDSRDFDVVKKEVSKILTEIRKHEEVTGVAVKQKCILLEIVCSSPHTVLDLLNYFESAEFDQSVCIISNELGYLCNTIFTIEANLTLESLKEIYDDRVSLRHSIEQVIVPAESNSDYGTDGNIGVSTAKLDPFDGNVGIFATEQKALDSSDEISLAEVKRCTLDTKPEVEAMKDAYMRLKEDTNPEVQAIEDACMRLKEDTKRGVQATEDVCMRLKEEDEWESCLQSKNESQIKKLIQENCIPSLIHLDAAYRIFKRSSELLGDIFALVSEYIKKQSPHILRVYAAYDDRKNSESNYCFLVFTRQSEAGLKPLNVVYPIKIVRIEDCSEEDEDVVKEILMSHGPPVNISHVENNLNKVISDHSERLMKETKNITLITTSMYRSQNYQRGNPPCLVNDPCVVILVMHKNWIPIGSKPLPREINGIPVDVREGIAVKFRGKLPSEKHDNVRIGCRIESSGLPGSGHSSWVCNAGTLGGFILGSNSTIYGFTCAHILFPDKTLKEMQRDEKIYIGEDLELSVMKQKEEVSRLDIIVKRLEERKVYQASCEMDEYLGTVEMALYALGSTFDYTGVDFAVVKIDAERIPNTTEFPYVDDSGTFKRETEGASTERDFRFNSGKIIDEDLKCGEEVIKYGCRTLLTTGIFLGKRTFNNIDGETWYGQCEIVSNSSFAKESDSGSLVFRQKESDLEAACILLGGTRVRFAATYFPDILERTGLKDITFLKFDSPETKE